MNQVYLSVASNIDPEANILAAMERLARGCQLSAISRCFVTDAIPAPDQPPTKDLPYFINCVARLETESDARTFKFEVLRSLERELGRVRSADKYAPRPIDLDILLFNEDVIQEDQLEIPDPDITKRWFLAQGILDIEPDILLPSTQQPLSNYLQPLLDQFFATEQTYTENAELRAEIQKLMTTP